MALSKSGCIMVNDGMINGSWIWEELSLPIVRWFPVIYQERLRKTENGSQASEFKPGTELWSFELNGLLG
jgi:hypothetical protein